MLAPPGDRNPLVRRPDEDEAGAVLTDQQRADLAATGLARLPGVVDRAAADAMVDAVWAALVGRGVDRGDRSTWPVGMPSKLQALRKGEAFAAFDTDLVRSVVDELLGTSEWLAGVGWGPLVTFPEPGPWTLPHKTWHLDLPGRAGPDGEVGVARLFGFAGDVVPQGGGTLVVEGSHEIVRRMVAASPGRDVGGSVDVRKRLSAHPWFRALQRDGTDRIRRFMEDGDEIDGVPVRVVELTGDAGDVVVMAPWTVHNLSPNTSDAPRCMCTRTMFRADSLALAYGGDQATGSDATP